MITALVIIAAVALLFEVAGLFYCAGRNIPFGRGFGASVFVQISIPVTLITAALIWNHFSPAPGGLEPFTGTGFDRGFRVCVVFLITEFAATLAAGLLGFCRIFFNVINRTRHS
jgi:hypothetical protein